MKIGNLPNYLVQVYRSAEDQPAKQAPLYEGIFTLVLNIAVRITFVPDVGGVEAPWPNVLDSPSPDEFTTAAQARWYELLSAECAVTPSEIRAGRSVRTGPADLPRTIFSVTPSEFRQFAVELDHLAEHDDPPRLFRADVLNRSVMRFVDEQVLNSPLLDPSIAEAVGRKPPVS